MKIITPKFSGLGNFYMARAITFSTRRPRPAMGFGYSSKRSDFFFERLGALQNEKENENKSNGMSEERVLFEVERMLMDNVQILNLMKSDPGTLDFLFKLVSDMGHARLGIPLHQNVHKVVVEQGGDENYQHLLENTIRPAMYSIECAFPGGTGAAVFIYRCFNAASIICLYDRHRMPVDDFRFKVDVARMARDVVGEWVDF